MRQFRAPQPNRHGRFEVHDVIPRKEAWYRARGWTEVTQDDATRSGASEVSSPWLRTKVFDVSGPWLKTRKQIMEDTGLDLPKTKAEAVKTLKAAGYEVR